MKKSLYYLSPFIIFPIWVLLSELLLDDLWGIPIVSYIFIGGLLAFSALIGWFTPAQKKVDFRITFWVPLAFFLTMFVAAFFDTGTCSGEPRLDFVEAFRISTQPWFLLVYILMALITFLASFVKIRIIKKKLKKV